MKGFCEFEVLSEEGFEIANENHLLSFSTEMHDSNDIENAFLKYKFDYSEHVLKIFLDDQTIDMLEKFLKEGIEIAFEHPFDNINMHYAYYYVIEKILPLLAKNIVKGTICRAVTSGVNNVEGRTVMYFVGPGIYITDHEYPLGFWQVFLSDGTLIDIEKEINLLKLSKNHLDFLEEVVFVYDNIRQTMNTMSQASFVRKKLKE